MTPRPGIRSLRVKLLVAFCSLVFTFLLAFVSGEVYVRHAMPYETPDTLRETSLQYEPTLFTRYAFPKMEQSVTQVGGTGQYRINKRGYRGRDFEVPKPPGALRILVLGGSAAFDMYAPDGRDWPHLVEDGLRARGWGQVEVINAGTPGYATWDSLGRLYSEAWMFQPDYVLVYNAWNDIKYYTWLSPDQSLERGYRPTTPSMYGSDLNVLGNPFMYYSNPLDRLLSNSQLYVRLRWRVLEWQMGMIGVEGLLNLDGEAGPPIKPPYRETYSDWGLRQYELNLRLIADASREIGARPVLLTQATLVSPDNTAEDMKHIGLFWVNLSHDALVRAFADSDATVIRVAKDKNIPVLDLSKMFSGKSELFADHIHTTIAGSEALAGATADFLAGVLTADGQRTR